MSFKILFSKNPSPSELEEQLADKKAKTVQGQFNDWYCPVLGKASSVRRNDLPEITEEKLNEELIPEEFDLSCLRGFAQSQAQPVYESPKNSEIIDLKNKIQETSFDHLQLESTEFLYPIKHKIIKFSRGNGEKQNLSLVYASLILVFLGLGFSFWRLNQFNRRINYLEVNLSAKDKGKNIGHLFSAFSKSYADKNQPEASLDDSSSIQDKDAAEIDWDYVDGKPKEKASNQIIKREKTPKQNPVSVNQKNNKSSEKKSTSLEADDHDLSKEIELPVQSPPEPQEDTISLKKPLIKPSKSAADENLIDELSKTQYGFYSFKESQTED